MLNHNSLKKLGPNALNYLQSIVDTEYPSLETIVVDNASQDGSDKVIEDSFKQIKMIRLGRNAGYAGGNNTGAKACAKETKYIAFLNNDLIVEKDWLRKIIETMESDESIAAAQPKILQLRDKTLLDSLGGMIDRIGRAYDLGHGLPDRKDLKKPFQTFYARGAAIIVRRDLYERLGGFDEDFFIYYEETDLCWRIRLLGYKIVTVPESVVYHLGGGTTGGETKQTIYLRRRNQLATLIKNYSIKNAFKYASQLAIKYMLYALERLLIKRDHATAQAILSATAWNLVNLRKTLRKRASVQGLRKISDDKLLKLILTPRMYDLLTSYLKPR